MARVTHQRAAQEIRRRRKQAQQYALRGDSDTAWGLYLENLRKGDASAGASLAEIAAFRGDWAAVTEYASIFVRDPLSADTTNVYGDMVNLLALSGIRLNGWRELAQLTKDLYAGVLRYDDSDWSPYVAPLERLLKFAELEGRGSYVWNWATYTDHPEDVRAQEFNASIERLSGMKMKFSSDEERRDHLLAVAVAHSYYSGVVALYDQLGPPASFASIVFLSSGLARFGRSGEAWLVLKSNLYQWWPVDSAQVAPVELLMDEALRPLMTPERCVEVLRTPRGPEAGT